MMITARSLLRRRRRTALTIAGVALGAATYMVLLAAGRGLLEQFRESAKILGAEVVVQQRDVTSAWSSLVSREATDHLAALPGVRRVSPIVLGKTRFLDAGYFLIFGATAGDTLLDRLVLVEGRPLSPHAESAEMLVGSWAARRFNLGAGHLVETRQLRFEVAGVYQSGRALLDSGAIIDIEVARRLFNSGDGANLVLLDVEPPAAAADVAHVVNRFKPEVEAHPTSEWVESYGQVAVIETFARFLAMIAVVIATLGVSNVLHITVSERTAELATLRAIGWSRWRVASLVLFEGATLSFLGGLAAVPLAAGVLLAVGSVDLGGYTTAGLIPVVLPVRAALEGMVVSLLAGTLGSLPPLARALRLQPAQALRAL
jgi:putative ABC transport system permease protein